MACSLGIFGLFLLLAGSARAQTSMYWQTSPGSNSWNVDGNWADSPGGTSGGVSPNDPTTTAVFGDSSQTGITFDFRAYTQLAGMAFGAGAPAYTFDLPFQTMVLYNGLTDSSGHAPTFHVDGGNPFAPGLLDFQGGSAGDAQINVSGYGSLVFEDADGDGAGSAGNANITISDFSSNLQFWDGATAANSTITATNITTVTVGNPLNSADVSTLGAATVHLSGGSVLAVEAASTLGSATIDVATSAEISLRDQATAGSASLDISTGGSLFAGGESSGGTATINVHDGGIVDISFLTSSGFSTGSVFGDGSIYLGDRNLSVGSDNRSTEFSGQILDGSLINYAPGSGSLTKTGTGVWTLSGANSFTGETVVSGGTLLLANSAALAGSTLNYDQQGGAVSFGTLTAATLGGLAGSQNLALTNTNGHAVALSVGDNSTDTTYSGVLNGAGSLTKEGDGTLTLTGTNLHTGGTIVSSGTLQLGDSGTVLPDGGRVTVNNGVFALGDASETIGSLDGTGGTVQISAGHTLTIGADDTSSVYGGEFGGGGGLTKAGTGTLQLGGFLNGGYGGDTVIAGGTLRLDNGFGYSRALTDSTLNYDNQGGVLDFGTSDSVSLGGLEGAQDIVLENSNDPMGSDHAVTLDLGWNNADTVYSGVLSGAGALLKFGTGTLTLSGANTEEGGVSVREGTLKLGIGGSFGAADAALSLYDGGTVDLGGQTVVLGPVIMSGGTLRNGSFSALFLEADAGLISADITGDTFLVKSYDGDTELSGNNSYTGSTLIFGGTLRIDSAASMSAATNYALGGGALGVDAATASALTFGSDPGQVSWLADGGFALLGADQTLSLLHGAALTWGVEGFMGDASAGDNNALILGSDLSADTLTLANAIDFNNDSRTIEIRDGQADVDVVLAGDLTGVGDLTLEGEGTVSLTGHNTYSGDTYVEGATLLFEPATALGGGGLVLEDGNLKWAAGYTADPSLGGGLTLSGTVDGFDTNGNDITLAGPLSGAAVDKYGAGRLTLAGVVNVDGLEVDEGSLLLPSGEDVTTTYGIMVNDGDLTIHGTLSSSDATTLSGIGYFDDFVGSSSVTVSGTGAQLDIAGSLLVGAFNEGTLTVSDGAEVDSGPGSSLSDGVGGNGTVTVTGAGSIWNTADLLLSAQSGGGTLQIEDGGEVNVGAGTGILRAESGSILIMGGGLLVSSSDSYLGANQGNINLTISGAGSEWLVNAGSNALALGEYQDSFTYTEANITLADGGLLDVENGAGIVELAALSTLHLGSGSGAGTISAARIDNDGTIDANFTGVSTLAVEVDGAGVLTKEGAGVLSVTGDNGFAGGVTLTAGAIEVGNDDALGTGTLTLAGGTLQGDGTPRTLANPVALSADSAIGGASDLSFTGTLTNSGGDHLLAVNNSGGTSLADIALSDSDTGHTLTIAGSGDVVVNGVISNGQSSSPSPGGLVVSGTGTTTLVDVNTYTGPTRVTSGRLKVNGSIVSSILTTVSGTGVLSGNGSVGPLTVASGGTVSPGNPDGTPGTLTTGDEIWERGGMYEWQITDATGTAGADPGYDWLDIGGTLTINSTSVNPFTIKLTGTAANFDPSVTYTWTIASASGGISNFNPDEFLIDSSAFFDAPGTNRVSIAVSPDGQDLDLTFTAIPEPNEWGAIIGGALLGLAVLRRRKG